MAVTDRSEQWPTQDGIDRSQSFAIMAVLSLNDLQTGLDLPTELRWELGDEVKPQLETAVNESIREVLATDAVPTFYAEHYQIGPAAEGFAPDFIVTIWENRQDLALALST